MALSVVDTPGVGSVYQHNTVTAETAMRTMDVAVSVLTMDPPISAAEYDLLSKVRGLVAAAIDICQLGRFYDRFADHAAAVTDRVIHQVTGHPRHAHTA